MIKLTKISGEHVLVNIFTVITAQTAPSGTLICDMYVRESLDEIQEITARTCISMLRRIAAELAEDAD